jgi:hypothetical protein
MGQIINGALQLRKMATRSIIGFGKYSDLMVGDLLKGSHNERQYLAYLYYNKELVSFIDEVLDDLKIEGDLVIDKPGINPNVKHKWDKSVMTELDKLRRYNLKRRDIKHGAASSGVRDKKQFSKGSMQAINQGRK